MVSQDNDTWIAESRALLFPQTLYYVFCSTMESVVLGNQRSDRREWNLMNFGEWEENFGTESKFLHSPRLLSYCYLVMTENLTSFGDEISLIPVELRLTYGN